MPEDWGGSNVFVEVSAKLINIDQMLEMILLVADLQEIKANPNTKAMGTVIESRLDRARGSIATLLVQNGTSSSATSSSPAPFPQDPRHGRTRTTRRPTRTGDARLGGSWSR